ncbi:WGR domain-containing protein [Chitinophaga skermanii]|uniref:WGR domain-containing protein n=1 Tax=Chitinophaga skermanii TaxID=331697 RepID=A0A327QEX3_9BACT|nr:AAA domain-containing protein [Chitinophaga skermanii]RAJ02428.1 WGR domain-containing protein [Chitinophaga skermanii]
MSQVSFPTYLETAFEQGPWSTDEIVAFLLPIFEEVFHLHEHGLVAPFEVKESVFVYDANLDIDEQSAHVPALNLAAISVLLQKNKSRAFDITGTWIEDEELPEMVNAEVHTDEHESPTRPAYLLGYQCYEHHFGHHDVQSDIFCLGLYLGSLVMGLNLYQVKDVQKFAQYRKRSITLNKRVHPTIHALVAEMTHLDRRARPRDLSEVLHRLRYYRDYDPLKQTDLASEAIFEIKQPNNRKSFILSKLRNRLFDTSRRNRLLYYKPNARFVNLTISSVPNVLNYQSIEPALLFTWSGALHDRIIGMKDISLNKQLQFIDHPYLNSQLNTVRISVDNDEKEYGFSQLKLVVAFFNWYNLKEDDQELIQSPLLLLPVKLKRTKSLQHEQFTLALIDNEAIINPVLANYLKDLYGIQLPASIDFEKTSMEQFYEALRAKIEGAQEGITLQYISKPRIKIIHSIAKRTIQQYEKKLKSNGNGYANRVFAPLSLAIHYQKIIFAKEDFAQCTLSNPHRKYVLEGKQSTPTFAFDQGENNPYAWEFDVCNIVLGNFNYKKMSLVRDYQQVEEMDIEHPVFNELFSNLPKTIVKPLPAYQPSDWFQVITADPTQTRAILQARTGKSYIIQGPPGTGKSQTITNLIADFLALGKTVLFVCEKRAALDVVYHRLQQNHLAELCCYIHDSQDDKKEFVRDLKAVYDDFLHKKMDLQQITFDRKIAMERLQDKLDVLENYHFQQNNIHEHAGTSTRKLIEQLLVLREDLPTLTTQQQDKVPSYSHWQRFGSTLTQLSEVLAGTGAEKALALHPFSNLSSHIIQSANPFQLFNQIYDSACQALEQFQQLVQEQSIPATYATKIAQFAQLITDAVILSPLANTGNLDLVDPSNEAAKVFDAQYQTFQYLAEQYQQTIRQNNNWAKKFSEQETRQAVDIAAKYESSFFKFLSGSWRRLKREMKIAYNFDAHVLPPTISMVLQELQAEYDAQAKMLQQQQLLKQDYHVDNIHTVKIGIEALRRKLGDADVDYLLHHPHANTLVLQLNQLATTFQKLDLQLKQTLYNYAEKSFLQLQDELVTIESNLETLRELLPALKDFTLLPEELQSTIRQIPLTPAQAAAAMALRSYDLILTQSRGFANTQQENLHQTVNDIARIYQQVLHLNSDFIRATRRSTFLTHYEISAAKDAILDEDEKAYKKSYLEGRKILEHEMSKTMRYKSIREMASDDSGRVLKDIKPVWLMSPLSVSDSLPLDIQSFDVVIFDEASQIPLEEGIPALFRAPQTIIVGDDKQMPPSNFFNTKTEDPNDLESFEGEKEDEILSSESDSLLIQGARKLPSTMLRWHYRSRYETLISYSNHAFYAGELLTIPDRTSHLVTTVIPPITQTIDGLLHAPKLLQQSISYHYLPNSLYASRKNVMEAEYIAYVLKQLLTNRIEESIGIVAFSQEQQLTIETAIEKLADKDKTFESLLEAAYNRKEEGQFTGLFVKNLENVQGDERDIIIISTCYGRDAKGKMLMNFGPINRKGGEKRLNVIFSRAKKHMAVVSSMKYQDITNDYNEGANYLKRFLHYAETVSNGQLQEAKIILKSLLPTTQLSKQSLPAQYAIVTQQISDALIAAGYEADTYIGQSSFKCSIAVKRKGEKDFSLGILVDEDQHYDNPDVLEQYYQRPATLRAFGWPLLQVYAKDWLQNRDNILQSILQLLQHPVQQNRTVNGANTQLIYLENRAQQKFWEISPFGTKLKTRFGKIGSAGQSNVQTYLNNQEALQEMEQLIAVKKDEGYSEL